MNKKEEFEKELKALLKKYDASIEVVENDRESTVCDITHEMIVLFLKDNEYKVMQLGDYIDGED